MWALSVAASPRYDRGEGRRRWRALDLGTTKVFLEAARAAGVGAVSMG